LLTGMVSQFVVLPALTFGMLLLTNPQPSIALGLILVAACPGWQHLELHHPPRGRQRGAVGVDDGNRDRLRRSS
jgi:hypothetical protein